MYIFLIDSSRKILPIYQKYLVLYIYVSRVFIAQAAVAHLLECISV